VTLRALSLLGPATVYLAGIFVLGSAGGGAGPAGVSDKVAHLVAFGILALPMARALRYFRERPLAERLGRGALLSSLAGALLEVWQAFLPHRSAELLDWVADTAGAFGVALVAAVVARRSSGGREPGGDGAVAPRGSESSR
jgi:hypothetical protein